MLVGGTGMFERRLVAGVDGVTVYQLVVLWQLLQSSVVATCRTVLPSAMTPLWQLRQVPVAFRWVKSAGCHARVP